jgi:hypothetical protein
MATHITAEALNTRLAAKVAEVAEIQVKRAELAAQTIQLGAAIDEIEFWIAQLNA